MLRSAAPAIRIIGATLTPARGSPEFGAREEDRKALNAFIRASGLFDAVIDFDGATANPRSGALKPEYAVPTNGVSKRTASIRTAPAISPWPGPSILTRW